MLNEILDTILSNSIAILIAGLGSYVSIKIVPWLKKLGVYSVVRICVAAAEKLGETSQIDKNMKKDYVIKALEEAGITVTPLVETMIEAAVKELDTQANKISDVIING